MTPRRLQHYCIPRSEHLDAILLEGIHRSQVDLCLELRIVLNHGLKSVFVNTSCSCKLSLQIFVQMLIKLSFSIVLECLLKFHLLQEVSD
jgi:hypothetical protein